MSNFLYHFYKHLKNALVNIKRHLAMSISAMSAVCVTLMLFSVFLLLASNITKFTNAMEEGLRIHVVLNDKIQSSEQIQSIKTQIENMEGVKNCKFSSKDEELQLMIEEHGENLKMYEGKKNPLRNAFFVAVDSGNQLSSINVKIKELDGVYDSVYGGTSVAKFISILDSIRTIGFVFVLAFAIVTILLIANSIKLTIYARSNEIVIMRNVGATNNYIQIPFVIEGMLIGLGGAILPCIFTYLGYEYFYQMVHGNIVINMFQLYKVVPFTYYICMFLCVFGILVGILGSYYATRKYLHATR